MSQTVHFGATPFLFKAPFRRQALKRSRLRWWPKISDVALSQFAGSRKVLNIFPSIDTGVCAASVRKFNQLASELDNTVVLCISADLPFAQSRFCGAEGLNNVVTLSTLRGAQFWPTTASLSPRARWPVWRRVLWSSLMKMTRLFTASW